ncbi:MAG: DUF4886 domain-containing protein [Clostridia bacterium]|nr:DUF4886 domain-containing protein [Clostridia bacterium]
MKKILAIGNSFSEDATRYIHQIAESAGEECLVVNLYIGGCPLWYHADNIVTNKQEYRYERNGEITERRVSISEVMDEEDWDIVTIQQVSGLSGKIDSFTPFADELIAYIRVKKSEAKILYHQTWSYPNGSRHPDFAKYDFSQKKMYEQIVSASRGFAASRGIGVLPAGEVIERLRGMKEFDPAKGGVDLCRDGFHLNLVYGRYAAGAAWFATLFGEKDFSYVPEGADEALCALIRKTVFETARG